MLPLIQAILLISLQFASIAAKSTNPQDGTAQHNTLANVAPTLPRDSASHGITVPTDMKLKYLALGVGTQNYTCSEASPTNHTLIWVYLGAMADMRDLSKNISIVLNVTNDLMKGHKGGRKPPKENDIKPETLSLLGKHSFQFYPGQPKPAVALPTFDFSVSLHGPKESVYLAAKKTGIRPPPTNPHRNVPWLELETVKGSLAQKVLRTKTRGGVAPPGTCKKGESHQSRYAAVYWFYG